jgi:hypothetical protein
MIRHTLTAATLLLLGVAAAPLGCASDEAKGEPVTVDDFPARYAAAVCSGYTRCCSARQLTFADEAGCRSLIESALADALAQLGPKQRFDAAVAQECLAYGAALTCQYDAIAERNEPRGLTPCERFIDGTVAPGGACESRDDCAWQPGEVGGGCTNGACSSILGAKLGESCSDQGATPRDCDEQAWCDSGTCAARKSGGATCNGNDQCESQDCFNGSCLSKTVDGNPCTLDVQCASAYCGEDATFGRACVRRAAVGEDCTSHEQCASLACEDGKCTPLKWRATPEECAGTFDI